MSGERSGEFGKMNRFDISVIVPCFKPEARFLRQCLHSLCGQTLPHSRYEVILILNGCGEPWLSVANDMIGAFELNFNITLLHTMERGVSNARNLGLDAARGEYIAFVDYDDYVSGSYLESLLRVAYPTVVALSDAFPFHDGCAGVMDDREAQCHKAWSQYKDAVSPSLYDVRRLFNGPCMKLVHRSIIGPTRNDPSFPSCGDVVFMFEISRNIRSVKFVSDGSAVYYRRYHKASIVMSLTFREVVYGRLHLCMAITRIWCRAPFRYNWPFALSRYLGASKAVLNRCRIELRRLLLLPRWRRQVL